MFWTHTLNEGQSKKRFFLLFLSLFMYIQVFVERSNDYGSLVLCTIKDSITFWRGSFYTLTCHIYIFSFYEYTSHLLTYISYVYLYIYLYTSQFLLSLWQLNTRQASVNERKPIISDRLPDRLLCNHHLLTHCLSDMFYLYLYIWQGEETICSTLSLRLCHSHQWEHFIYTRMPH
jgi:hypothetical protein